MKRIVYFDLLNIFACISVVALHSNGYVHTFAHDTAWMQSAAVEVLFYAAVPLFFMLSGSTLFHFRKKDNTRTFYQKRIKKTVIPYLIFSIGLYVLYWIKNGIKGGFTDFDFVDFINSIFTGHIPLAHYWFFIPLFIYYMFVPFLEKIVCHSSRKALLALLGFVFTFLTLFPFLNFYLGLSLPTSPTIYGFAIYAILGYVLSNNEFEKKNSVLISAGIITIICWIWRYYSICHLETFNSFYFTYYNFYALAPAIFFFLLFKRFDSRLQDCPKLANALKAISSLSFGVYLFHGLVMFSLPFGQETALYRFAGIPIVYAISATLTYMIKRFLPFGKIIIP